MQDCLSDGGDGDHGAVEDDERDLALHDGVAPAACHLDDTVDASDEDAGEGHDEAGGEEAELGALQEHPRFGGERRWCAVSRGDVRE